VRSVSVLAQVHIDGFSIRNCMAKDGGAFVFRHVRSPRVGKVDEAGADASSCTGIQEDGDVFKVVGERCAFVCCRVSRCSLGPSFEPGVLFVLVMTCFHHSLAAAYHPPHEPTASCRGTPVFHNCYFYNNLASGFGGAIYIKDGDTNTLGYATKAHSQGQTHRQRGMMHALHSMHHPLHSDSFNDVHVITTPTYLISLLTINLTP
jgi:predicted outer membrane repeat protein